MTCGPEPTFQVTHVLTPQNEKVGDNLGAAFPQPETRRGRCFACSFTIDTNLARNHHPASDCSQTFANMPQLPILDFFFFALSSSLKARSPFAEAQKEGKSTGRSRAALTFPLATDERPEGAGGWGRCSSAFGAARGLACAHELPLSDFPTAELQPSPCPCLKNFLNSIPVLFLTALKPHCLYFNKALSGQVTATGLAPASN